MPERQEGVSVCSGLYLFPGTLIGLLYMVTISCILTMEQTAAAFKVIISGKV